MKQTPFVRAFDEGVAEPMPNPRWLHNPAFEISHAEIGTLWNLP
ncbi:hypothetical protein [Bradyrhizobium sp. STM 3557]